MKKHIQKAFTLLLIFALSFQLAFAETISRLPASIEHKQSFEDLTQAIADFGRELRGEDGDNCLIDEQDRSVTTTASSDDASSLDLANLFGQTRVIPATENTEEMHLDHWSHFSQNACAIEQREELREQEQQEQCVPDRYEGLIERLARQALDDENNDRPLEIFEVMDRQARRLHRQGEDLMGQVRLYLHDRSIHVDQRQDLLVDYLENVLMPMRDFIVLKRSYQVDQGEYDGLHYYRSLLIQFPMDLVQAGNLDFTDRVEMGPNPSGDPFYLDIIDLGWGRMGLEFRELEIMNRDILTLMRAPTLNNYMVALRWMTLQMMLSQVFVYDSMLGVERPLEVPRSCQAHNNGAFPHQVFFNLNEGNGDDLIDAMLENHGLTYMGNNYDYIEYYMENISRDPREDGYSGIMPFEEYKNALQGMAFRVDGYTPSIDDFSFFDRILGMRSLQAQSEYFQTTRAIRRANRTTYIYNDIELLEKIIDQPDMMTAYEIITDDGVRVEVDPQRQNLSTFLVEVMQRQGALDVEEIISDRLREQLAGNTLEIPFPSLYGADIWRNWAIVTLRDYLTDTLEQGPNSLFQRAMTRSCSRHMSPAPPAPGTTSAMSPDYMADIENFVAICDRRDFRSQTQALIDYLSQFHLDGVYLPARRIEETQLQKVYPFLRTVWNELQRSGEFSETTPSEYEFLLGQLRAYNPWARLRLGYLVARDEMDAQMTGFRLTYQGRRLNENSRCFYQNVEGQLTRLDRAARRLGIDREVKPFHADRLLSWREKESLWTEIVEEYNESNSHLFTVEDRNRENMYSHLDRLSYKTILTREQADEFIETLPFQMYRQDQQQLTEVFQDQMAMKGERLFEIYQAQGDFERQQGLYQAFARDFGISSEHSAKLNFLALNEEIKLPIYRSIVRYAAENRRRDLLSQLEDFCQFRADEHESIKTFFFMTSKNHNKLNQLIGLPSVPDSVMDEVGRMMSPSELQDLFKGLGVMVLAIGAIIIGSTCAGVTGGLCAPLSVAMIGAGVGAFSLQANLVGSEWDRKIRANHNAQRIQLMEDLGFALHDSQKNVSRSGAWTVMEASFLIPLAGLAARSVGLGGRLAYVSGQNVLRGSGKEVFQSRATRAVQEVEVRHAQIVLGLDGIGMRFQQGASVAGEATSRTAREAMTHYRQLSGQYFSGQISTRYYFRQLGELLTPFNRAARGVGRVVSEEFAPVVVRQSVDEVNAQTARVVSQYFGHNPKHFARLLASYSGKRLDRAIEVQARLQANPSGMARVPVLGRAVNWFRNLRTEHLANNALELRRLNSELASLNARGENLEAFILRNIDSLTDVFLNIPMRKRDAPYLFFWLGAPHIQSRRLPVFAELADGIIVRKFFTARGRLVHESLKATARAQLGLPLAVASETTYIAVRALDQSVHTALEQGGREGSRALSDAYRKFQDQAFDLLKESLANSRAHRMILEDGQILSELSDSALRRLIFSPQNAEQRALAEVIWQGVPLERLLATESLDQVAHKAAQSLSNYNHVDQFENFLNALKIITLRRDHAVVDFF